MFCSIFFRRDLNIGPLQISIIMTMADIFQNTVYVYKILYVSPTNTHLVPFLFMACNAATFSTETQSDQLD